MKSSLTRYFPAILLALCTAEATLHGGQIYGSVGYSYAQEWADRDGQKSEYRTFLQNYGIGYRSYLYSPKLMTYDLFAGFNASDGSTTTNHLENETQVRDLNYRARLGFIQATRFPFSIYAEKRSSPTTDISSDLTLSLEEEIERYSIDGRMNLSTVDIAYGAQKYTDDSQGPLLHDMRDEMEYRVSLGKRKRDYDYRLSYTRRDLKREDEIQHSNGSLEKRNYDDLSDQMTLQHRLSISKTVKWNNYAYYYDSSSQQQKSVSLNSDLNWRPSDRYSASISVMGSYYAPYEGGDSKAMALHANSNYKVTENLSTTQSIGLGINQNETSETNNALAQLGVYYHKRLFDGPAFRIGGYVSMNSFNADRVDANATENDKEILMYALNGGVSQRFDPIRSTVDVQVDYYSSDASTHDARQRYALQGRLNTNIAGGNNKLGLYYSKEDIESADYGASWTEYMHFDESFLYNASLGINGRLSSQVGVQYAITRSSAQIEQRRSIPYLDLNANYRMLRQIQLKAHMRVDKDFENDLMNYLASFGMGYNIRQIQLNFDAYYFEQNSDAIGKSSRVKVLMKVSRRF